MSSRDQLNATIERVRLLYVRDVWRTTTTCAPVMARCGRGG